MEGLLGGGRRDGPGSGLVTSVAMGWFAAELNFGARISTSEDESSVES